MRILAKNLDLDLRFGAPAIAAAAKALWKLATNDLEVQVCSPSNPSKIASGMIHTRHASVCVFSLSP